MCQTNRSALYLSPEFVVEFDHLLLLRLREPPPVLGLDALGPHLRFAHRVPGILLAERILLSAAGPLRLVPHCCLAKVFNSSLLFSYLQVGTLGCTLAFVDTKTKILSQYPV